MLGPFVYISLIDGPVLQLLRAEFVIASGALPSTSISWSILSSFRPSLLAMQWVIRLYSHHPWRPQPAPLGSCGYAYGEVLGLMGDMLRLLIDIDNATPLMVHRISMAGSLCNCLLCFQQHTTQLTGMSNSPRFLSCSYPQCGCSSCTGSRCWSFFLSIEALRIWY